MPVIFKGSVMNNVSLSASNLILNHKNNESYYYHTTLIRLLRFQVNIYPANYYYHDSNGSFIIRTGCLFELLGDYTGKFWLFYIKKWCFQQSIQNKIPPFSTELEALFTKHDIFLLLSEFHNSNYTMKNTQSYAENE